MAYKDIPDDLSFRSEFSILSLDEKIQSKPRVELKEIPQQLYSYQNLAKMLIQPRTPYKRVLIKNDTGTGKTKIAKEIGYNFIEIFRKEAFIHDVESIGKVLIVTFNKEIFYNELIPDEATAEELKVINEGGVEASELAKQNIVKRLTNRNSDNPGFWSFMGYKALANKVYNYADEKAILDGTAVINHEFVSSLENSVIICDELHIAYNSTNKNTWGSAIQYISDSVKTVTMVYMTSTPIESSPDEIVFLSNFLNPPQHRVTKEDLFDEDNSLRSDAHITLKRLLFGKILYMPVTDISQFPKRVFIGKSFSEFPTIKYIPCKLTPKHLQSQVILTNNEFDDDIAITAIDGKIVNHNYQMHEFSSSFVKDKEFNGPFMKIKYLEKYSCVDANIIRQILNILSDIKTNKKILLYDSRIIESGLIFIKNALKWNGFIELGETANDSTLCSYCGVSYKLHKSTHVFKPSTVAILYNEISKHKKQSILSRYGSLSNNMGHELSVLLGGRTIRQSINFNCIGHIIVRYPPPDMASFIQLSGRGRRSGSHLSLPPSLRFVNHYIYIPIRSNGKSFTLNKYSQMLTTYKEILQIEKILHSIAVDAMINYNLIKNTFSSDNIRSLPYKPDKLFISQSEIITSTHDAFAVNSEIALVLIVIKKLFITVSPVWKCDDLINAIKNPPFRTEFNPSKLSDGIIVLAIDRIIFKSGSLSLSNSDHIIFMNKIPCKVKKYGDYYMLEKLSSENPYEDMFFQLSIPRTILRINVNNFVTSKSFTISFESKLSILTKKYSSVSIDKLDGLICEFDTEFHIGLIEMIIEHINTVLSKKNIDINDFYLKLLWYYNLIGSILFASNFRETTFNAYKSMTKKDVKTSSIESSIIKQELRRTKCSWCGDFAEAEYKKFADEIHSLSKKSDAIIDTILPVGHLIGTIPKILHPSKGWIFVPDYLDSKTKFKENPIIIGYNHKPDKSMISVFKLREPINSVSGDLRKVNRGVLCISKTRKSLVELAVKLGIEEKRQKNSNICEEIKSRLLLLELHERISGTSIKWFYQHYERQPFDLI